MRLLHTADWHLGRQFHGASLLEHQSRLLDWLVELAQEERVDAVLVAGDLYDRALPPAEAVALAGEALARLAADGRQVIVISGNHDSAQRLGFAAPILSRAGLHLRTDPTDSGRPVLLGGGAVAVYALPYLEPDLVADALQCQERTHEGVLKAAMARVRADLKARQAGTASIVMAHAFVAGASGAGSERELAVGGAAQVGAGLFSGAGYVALGHLHRAQAVRGGRYAGSPLALSFAEAADVKSVTLLELEPGRFAARAVPCPVPRALTRLRGRLEELLGDPVLDAHEHDWVEATITDAARPLEAMARLQRRFPHAVSLVYEPEGARPRCEDSYAERLRGLSEEEVLARFVLDVRGTPAEEEELALLRQALDAGRAKTLDLARAVPGRA